MAASQDFRDGAAWGAYELAQRAKVLQLLGIDPAPSFLESMAGQIRQETGGAWPAVDAQTGPTLSEIDGLLAKRGARVEDEQ